MREEIQARPASGDLRVLRKGMKHIAVLLGSDNERYVIPVLDRVRLIAMNDHGVLLTGTELYPPRGTKGIGPSYPQTWWCVLGNPDPLGDAWRTDSLQDVADARAGAVTGASMVNTYARRGRYNPKV